MEGVYCFPHVGFVEAWFCGEVAGTRQHALSDISDGQEVRECSIGECDANLLTAMCLRDEDRSEPEDGKSVSDDGDSSSGECEVRLTSHLPI